MLTNFWKMSKSASPFRERSPSNFKSDNHEQSPEPQAHVTAHVKIDHTMEDGLARKVTAGEYLITPDPLTSPNPSPTFSDAHETFHEQSEDTKLDLILQSQETSHISEQPESDMRDFDDLRNRQQANMEESSSNQDYLPLIQLNSSTATPSADLSELRDPTTAPNIDYSLSGGTDHMQTTSYAPSHPSTDPATGNRPIAEAPGVTARNATSQMDEPKSSSMHSVNTNQADAPTCHKPVPGSSAPPEDSNVIQRIAGNLQLTNDNELGITDVTTSNMPAHIQMLNQLQSWALNLRHVNDPELKNQIIDAISQRMEKVWVDAMRMGLIPMRWEDDEQTRIEIDSVHSNANALILTDQDLTEYDIVQHEWYPRGRAVDKDKSKRKRLTSPSSRDRD